MKKLVACILLLVISANAFGDCDWSKGITPNPNHTFVYSEACHLAVGQLVQDKKTKDLQIADLNKAITLKDLAITNAEARTQLWMTTADSEQSRLSKIDSDAKSNEWIFFGLGVLTVIGSGFMAAKLIGK